MDQPDQGTIQETLIDLIKNAKSDSDHSEGQIWVWIDADSIKKSGISIDLLKEELEDGPEIYLEDVLRQHGLVEEINDFNKIAAAMAVGIMFIRNIRRVTTCKVLLKFPSSKSDDKSSFSKSFLGRFIWIIKP